MINLEAKRVLITGGESFLGHAVTEALKRRQVRWIDQVPHSEGDLLEWDQARRRIRSFNPNYLIHLATYSGNIGFNIKYPADTFFRTTMMGLNTLGQLADKDVACEKALSVLSSCAIADQPGVENLKEESLWSGLPNPTIECHGLAKRNLHAFSRQLNKQYGLNAVCCILQNCYGPRDSFNLEKTKVVGALVKKFVDAKHDKLPEVICFGSGSPLREFVFYMDAGEWIVQTLEKYHDVDEPINLTSGHEVSIKYLAELIAELTGYKGNIIWDTSKPDGQMRKKLSKAKMCGWMIGEGWKTTPLESGLKQTIKWYEDQVR